jgi:hypothetical protein
MRVLRFLGPILFGIALVVRQSVQGIWSELFLFNAIPIACLFSILAAPRINNKWAQPLTALAIGSWSLGSITATTNSYVELSSFLASISDLFYLLFYPLALLGIQLLISVQQRLTILELVDASIVGLGLSTLGAAFGLQPVLPHLSSGRLGFVVFHHRYSNYAGFLDAWVNSNHWSLYICDS